MLLRPIKLSPENNNNFLSTYSILDIIPALYVIKLINEFI